MQSKEKQSKAKQRNPKQSKGMQSKAKQNNAKQSKRMQSKVKEGKAKQNHAKQSRGDPIREGRHHFGYLSGKITKVRTRRRRFMTNSGLPRLCPLPPAPRNNISRLGEPLTPICSSLLVCFVRSTCTCTLKQVGASSLVSIYLTLNL